MLDGGHIGCWKCEAVWLYGMRHDPRERCADGERYDFHPEGYVAFDNGGGVSFLYAYELNDDGQSGTIDSSGPLGSEYDLHFKMLDNGRMEMRMDCVGGYFTYEKVLDQPRSLDGYPNLSEATKERFFAKFGKGSNGKEPPEA